MLQCTSRMRQKRTQTSFHVRYQYSNNNTHVPPVRNVLPPHGVTTLVAYTQKDNQRKISAHLLRTDHQPLSLTMRPYGPYDAHPQVRRALLLENSDSYSSKNVHSSH